MTAFSDFIIPTAYCWPVRDVAELMTVAASLRTRSGSEPDGIEDCTASIAVAVDSHLNSILINQEPGWSSVDEEGHRVLFVRVRAPVTRDRRRGVEEAEPFLITVLLPLMAFDISEFEAAFGISSQEIIEERMGADVSSHIILSNGSMYLDVSSAFAVLSHEHPALLIALAFSLKILTPDVAVRIREYLHDIGDTLRNTQRALRTGFCLPAEFHKQVCGTLLTEAPSLIGEILEGSPTIEVFINHCISEAFTTFINEERMLLESFFEHNDDDTEIMSDIPETEIRGVLETKLHRACLNARRRLHRVRQSLTE